MWVVIESTAKYTLRGRTITVGDTTACMLAATTTTGDLIYAEFVVGFTAEQVRDGW